MELKPKSLYWTTKAKADLKEITKYYQKTTVAKAIVGDVKLLTSHPFLGYKEALLEHKQEGFRSLISGQYKIVYYLKEEAIIIVTIFDCRQDPDKMNSSI